MRMLPIMCAWLCVIASVGARPSLAQNYDRIITAQDITCTPSPGPDGGWLVKATVWLANESPTPLDLGCELIVSINGVPVSVVAQSVMVSNAGTGGSGCASSCVTDGWCAACKPSIIVPGTCYCSNHSVSTEFTVLNISAGDIISAYATALPSAAAEIATANDGAFMIVPTPGGYNRQARAGGVHYGRTATGEYALAGEVTLQSTWDGIDRNLSTEVLVLVNGTPYGGGGGGSGGCGGTAIIIYMGSGTLVGTSPPTFSCAEWCVHCQHTLGHPNGNICLPPGNSGPEPWCLCDENCSSARIVPGSGWQVIVPQLSAADQVTVIFSPYPGSLPELNTADDAVIVPVGDAALCQAVFADVGRQGGLPGGDGLFDNNDFIVFIGHFFDALPQADLGRQGGLFGPDGQFDNNDFIVFIDQFFAAC
ncbi:MAG: GC-type dockerin domain-anchored protein [Phycisphaerales bacterium]|nr:GC-type dockerin domain-anchored protein [Phycisphaerales bacterium]